MVTSGYSARKGANDLFKSNLKKPKDGAEMSPAQKVFAQTTPILKNPELQPGFEPIGQPKKAPTSAQKLFKVATGGVAPTKAGMFGKVKSDNQLLDLDAEQSDRSTKAIFDAEFRPGSVGGIYKLPKGDGGGKFEYAGINDGYHPNAFKAIQKLPEDQRAEFAQRYYKAYTKPASQYAQNDMTRYLLMDAGINRGPWGAVAMLNHAAGGQLKRAATKGDQAKIDAFMKLPEKEQLARFMNSRKKYESLYGNKVIDISSRWPKIEMAANMLMSNGMKVFAGGGKQERDSL